MLRQYRQTRGVEPETLASSLHVPVGKIQALEEDRLELMPDIMFARALAMSVCRYLKVDPAPVLARMPQQDASRVAPRDERGIDSPLSRPSLLPEGSAQILQRLLNARAAAVAVVVLGLLYLGIQSGQPPQPVAAPAAIEAPAVPAPTVSEATTTAVESAVPANGAAVAPPPSPVTSPVLPQTVTTPVAPGGVSK